MESWNRLSHRVRWVALVVIVLAFLAAGCGSEELATEAAVVGSADPDGDGIPTEVEGTGNLDGDEFPDYLDIDTDGDGWSDAAEGTVDTDGDDKPDYRDDDADGDGLLDADETAGDLDGDGKDNRLDRDSDNDGVEDGDEGTEDVNGNLIPDHLDADYPVERENATPPPDSDNDDIPDAGDNCREVANTDQANNDGDSIGDVCDNCPAEANQDQSTGGDNDTHPDACDNCPTADNEDQNDNDRDGIGDACGLRGADADELATGCGNSTGGPSPEHPGDDGRASTVEMFGPGDLIGLFFGCSPGDTGPASNCPAGLFIAAMGGEFLYRGPSGESIFALPAMPPEVVPTDGCDFVSVAVPAMRQLNLEQAILLMAKTKGGLDPVDYWTAGIVDVLSRDAIETGIPTDDWLRASPAVFDAVLARSPHLFDDLSPATIEGLGANRLGRLPVSSFGSMADNELMALGPDQLKGVPPSVYQGISDEAILEADVGRIAAVPVTRLQAIEADLWVRQPVEVLAGVPTSALARIDAIEWTASGVAENVQVFARDRFPSLGIEAPGEPLVSDGAGVQGGEGLNG